MQTVHPGDKLRPARDNKSWRVALVRPLLLSAAILMGYPARIAAAPPAGDSLADPIVQQGNRWLVSLDNVSATSEAGEPVHLTRTDFSGATPRVVGNTNRHSLWVEWTAPSNGIVQLVMQRTPSAPAGLQSAAFPSEVNVYTNAPGFTFLRRLSSTNMGRFGARAYRFPVHGGVLYRFALDSGDQWTGIHQVGLSYAGLPNLENDLAQNATALTAENPSAAFDLEGAGNEPTEPGFGAWDFFRDYHVQRPDGGLWMKLHEFLPRGGASRWFRWSPQRTGTFSLQVAVPGAFPQLAIYRLNPDGIIPADLSSLTLLTRITNGGNSAGLAHPELKAAITAKVNEHFLIQVDRLFQARIADIPVYQHAAIAQETGVADFPGSLNSAGVITLAVPAPNDDFSRAAPAEAVTSVHSRGGTFEPGEMIPAGLSELAGSLWWTWTPNHSGVWLLNGSRLQVFRGDTLTTLAEVSSQPGGPAHHFWLSAQTGERLFLRTITVPGESPRIRFWATPTNDAFTAATLIPPTPATAYSLPPGPLSVGPAEAVLPDPSWGSAWYAWVPDRTRKVRIYPVFGPGTGLRRMEVFAGDRPENLTSVASTTSSAVPLDFPVTAGQSYRFALHVDSPNWHTGASFQFQPPPANDDFASRKLLTYRVALSLQGETQWASAEPGEPAHVGRPATRSLWYAWHPGANTNFTLRISGAGRPRAALYRGDRLDDLSRVAEVSPGAASAAASATTQLRVRSEDRYVLVVEGGDDPTLAISVALTPVTPPAASDSFAGAYTAPATLTLIGAASATYEPAEPKFHPAAAGGSHWWRWQAPGAGCYWAYCGTGALFGGGAPTPHVTVFRGTNLASLVVVGRSLPTTDRSGALVSFEASEAEAFYVQVETQTSAFVDYQFAVLGQLALIPGAMPGIRPGDPIGTLRLSGSPGAHYRLEESPDMLHWTELGWLEIAPAETPPGTADLVMPGSEAEGTTRFIRSSTP
jgi:hypothetical protein